MHPRIGLPHRRWRRCATQGAPVLTKAGYYTEPSLAVLRRLSDAQLAAVPGFVVGRHGFGRIEWDGASRRALARLQRTLRAHWRAAFFGARELCSLLAAFAVRWAAWLPTPGAVDVRGLNLDALVVIRHGAVRRAPRGFARCLFARPAC
jgi:hypothetical protein